MSKSEEPKLRDILLPIIPKLIGFLTEWGKTRSKAEIARTDGTPVDANTLYRYSSGLVVPMQNLPTLGKGIGLSPDNMAWILGHFLTAEYERHRVDLHGQPDEVREPEPRYDEQNLERALDTVMALDLSGLDAEDTYDLTRERNALHTACQEVQSEAEDTKTRIERKVSAHLELLGLFRERVEKTRHRALSGS